MTRPLLSLIGPSLKRTVVHHARPPRVPVLHSPHTIIPLRPTVGTSHPHPPNVASGDGAAPPAPSTSSVPLEGTSLTFHHSPPPTAPSYTTGVTPPLLDWVRGDRTVRLTGEEGASFRRQRRDRAVGAESNVTWSEEVVAQMKALRAQGLSRREIGDSLSIPSEQRHLIARSAPLSNDQVKEKHLALSQEKASWGNRKRLSREIRERRKKFW